MFLEVHCLLLHVPLAIQEWFLCVRCWVPCFVLVPLELLHWVHEVQNLVPEVPDDHGVGGPSSHLPLQVPHLLLLSSSALPPAHSASDDDPAPDLDSVDLSSSRMIAPPSFAPPGSVSPSDLSPASSCCRQPSCAGSPPPGARSFHRPCNLGHWGDLHQSAIHGQRSNPGLFDNLEDLRSREFQTNAVH